MPGETYQTLKDKFSAQSGAAVGAAMAAQSAQVGGAATPTGQTSSGQMQGSFDPEFFGGEDQKYGAIADDVQEALSGIGTSENIQQLIKEREEKKKLQEQGIAAAQEKQDSLLGRIKTEIMGGGEGGNLSLTPDFKDTLPAGMHPLRKQYEYLAKKYGEGWKNTTQAKVLESYLSGVPVERGGGLGARSDETDAELIGPTNVDDIPMYDPITGKYRSLEERQALADAAQYRLDALNQFAGMGSGGIGSLSAAEAGASGFDLSKLDPERLRLGLSPDQYFRFRQQLMAADPTAENQLYKSTFPFASGDITSGLGQFIPGVGAAKTFLGGLLPERDLTGYQQNIDPIAAAFQPLPEDNLMGISTPSNIVQRPPFGVPLPDPSQPEKPKYPFPIRPELPYEGKDPRFPFPVGIASVFDPRFIGPSFRGSPYTNRGVSPAFYEALRRFS